MFTYGYEILRMRTILINILNSMKSYEMSSYRDEGKSFGQKYYRQ